jgi:hypothetical protein
VTATKNKLLVARETFVCELGGREVHVWAGETRIGAGHPLVKGREHLFEPAEPRADIEHAEKPKPRKR